MITASQFKPGVLKALVLCMNAPEEHVIKLHYRDKAGVVTERIVSPIRFVGDSAMLALCLSREEPRRFELEMCSKIELLSANDVLMPVEIKVVEMAAEKKASLAAKKLVLAVEKKAT